MNTSHHTPRMYITAYCIYQVVLFWFAALLYIHSIYITYKQIGIKDVRYLSIYIYMKARRNFFFYPPKLGDSLHTREFIALLNHSPLLRSPSIRIDATKFCHCSMRKGLVSSRGGGYSSLQFPLFGCIQQGRTVLYRPLCSA